MPISHENRVVFIHIPKNAGSSIEEALAIKPSKANLLDTTYQPEEIYALQHLPYEALQRALPQDVWQSYAKVCVVRNPWDRLVSDWRWRRKSSLPLGQLSFPDFARFVVKLVVPKGEKEEDPLSKSSSKGLPASWDAAVPKKQFAEQYLGHFKAQVAFAGEGVRVLRFETLRRDWASFTREVLGREVPLPYSNSSATTGKALHYSEEYAGDQALIDAVRSAYLDDVNTFGYSFETASAGKSKGSFKNLLGGFKKKAVTAKAKASVPSDTKAATPSAATASNEAADFKKDSNCEQTLQHEHNRAAESTDTTDASSRKRPKKDTEEATKGRSNT